MISQEPVLVLFSGGQDSTTCLAWCLNRFAHVDTVGFSYGQRHGVEMACRDTILKSLKKHPSWGNRLREDTILDLPLFEQFGSTAMTSEMEIHCTEQGIPNTFVPGRNLIFLTTAAMLAWKKGIRHLVIGVCEVDFSGYPDCRDNTIKAMQIALNLGMDSPFVIHSPLMWMSKADSWNVAFQEGGDEFVELVHSQTHTCYLGNRDILHAWGYGCGECPACRLRAAGWHAWKQGQFQAKAFTRS